MVLLAVLYQLWPSETVDALLSVKERLRADGSVEIPLRIGDLVRWISESGVQAVAVCMLHAYRNPVHELAVAEALRATGLPLSLSLSVANEFR